MLERVEMAEGQVVQDMTIVAPLFDLVRDENPWFPGKNRWYA